MFYVFIGHLNIFFFYFLFYVFNPHLKTWVFFTDFRERGREKERDINLREKHRCERETLIGCLPHTLQQGIEPAA